MRLGILGCDAIREEIEKVTEDEPDVVYREYLEFGLHFHPENLKTKILEKLRSLPEEVDVLFLGYGHCQSLKGLPQEVNVPVVMLEHEDCIATLLTSEKYHEEKKNGGITWFYPVGWAKYGMPGMISLFELDRVKSEYPPEFFLKMMFDGFSRCLFVDNGIGCPEHCLKTSKEFAWMLGLRHERMQGTIELIREAWLETKALAMELEGTKESSSPS